nr:hypothetical protein [Tanacetum cinerariifolium]
MQNQLTNLTDLTTKFMNSNSASTLSLGALSSNTIANSKSDLKAITTRSGVSYDGPQILPPVVENEPEATKDTVNPTNNGNTKDVQPQAVQSKPVTSEPAITLIFKDMSFEISFADALILMPKFASTLKALIGNKEKLSEMAQTPLNEHYSAVLLKKLPEKLGDPGKFLIPLCLNTKLPFSGRSMGPPTTSFRSKGIIAQKCQDAGSRRENPTNFKGKALKLIKIVLTYSPKEERAYYIEDEREVPQGH